MIGEGIRADFTVTESDEDASRSTPTSRSWSSRRRPTTRRTSRTSPPSCWRRPRSSSTLYKAGDDDAARALYPVARTHWERIETVAESFGDLDPKMDAREADLEPGQEWTGWHLIEKDLWPARAEDYQPLTHEGAGVLRRRPARQHREPRRPRVQELEYTDRRDRQRLARPARGGRDRQGHRRGGVLVADRPVGLPGQRRRRAGRVRGRAADRRGEGPGAGRAARPTRFDDLQALLDQHREGDGFVSYDELTPERGQGSSPTPSTRCPSRCRG